MSGRPHAHLRFARRRRMPVDAVVLDQVARMLRLPASREVRRRADDDEAKIPRDRDGDHVPIDHLAESDAGVESLGHDVDRLIGYEEVEP